MALSKMQTLYIETHAHTQDSKAIAKEVGATKKEVDAHIKTLPVPEVPAPRKAITAGDFIIRDSKNKQNNGVAIMNEAASGLADDAKKSRGSNPLKSFNHCIAPSKKTNG